MSGTQLLMAFTGLTLAVLAARHRSVFLGIFALMILYNITSHYILLPFARSANTRLSFFLILALSRSRALFRHTVSLFHSSPGMRVLIFWVGYILISLLIQTGRRSLVDLYELLGNIFYYIIITYCISSANRRFVRFILMVTITGFLLNMYARLPAILNISSLPFLWGVTRHQVAGGSALHALPLILFMVEHARRRTAKVVLWVLIGFSGMVAFSSGARTPLLGFTLIYLLYKRTLRRYAFTLLVGITLLPTFLASRHAAYGLERINTIISATSYTQAPEEIRFRRENIRLGFQAFLANPVFGVGYYNWQEAVFEKFTQTEGFRLATHNGYIRILAEMGLVGAVLFSALIYLHVKGTRLKPTGDFDQDLLYSGAFLVLSLFIYALGGDAFFSRIMYHFLAICTAAKLRIAQGSPAHEPAPATCAPPSSSAVNPSDRGIGRQPCSDTRSLSRISPASPRGF